MSSSYGHKGTGHLGIIWAQGVGISTQNYTCIYVYIYITCACIYIYIYIYVYTHTHTPARARAPPFELDVDNYIALQGLQGHTECIGIAWLEDGFFLWKVHLH